MQLNQGEQYEGFRVVAVVRKDNRSWVYRCESDRYPHPVDVRISLDPVQSEQTARRALREVAVLEQLTNSHVVRVHDAELGSDDHWYIVLEALDGARLDRWHDFDRGMDAAQAVTLVHQACLGLAEVHARGVVHRDLKPANLWVEPDGNLKIIDFASARGFGEGALAGDNVTTHHTVVGTPQYAAPEQALSATLTTASDVYSLGVILYELLSGHCPFWSDQPRSVMVRELAEEPIEWIQAHAHQSPVPLKSHPRCADLPDDLVALVDACLAKQPEPRPADAGVLANSLGWILHHRLGSAPVATMRVTDPSGVSSYRMVPPGAHRVGFGEGLDIRLRSEGEDSAWALLEWGGPTKLAELRTLESREVKINGQPIAPRAVIGAEDAIDISGFTLTLTYPRT